MLVQERTNDSDTNFCVGLLIINGKTLHEKIGPLDVEVLVMTPGRDKGDGTNYGFSTVTGHMEKNESIEQTILREASEECDVGVGLFSEPKVPFLLFEPKHRIGSKQFDNIIAGYLCVAQDERREDMEAGSAVYVRIGELLKADLDAFTRSMCERFIDKERFRECMKAFGGSKGTIWRKFIPFVKKK